MGLTTSQWQPLMTLPWTYDEVNLVLHVFESSQFSGECVGKQGQPVHWVAAESLSQYHFPAANKGILMALSLPNKMMISGDFDNLEDGLNRLQAALDEGIRLVQLRAKALDKADFVAFAHKAIQLCHRYGAKALINAKPAWLEDLPEADGLQLSSGALAGLSARPIAADKLLSVSTHSPLEIAKALALKADVILLSPVKATSSHPDIAPIGWSVFAEWVAKVPVPVYALGGMKPEDVATAVQQGAQGVAAISGFWPQKF